MSHDGSADTHTAVDAPLGGTEHGGQAVRVLQLSLRDYFAGQALAACIRNAPMAAAELQNPDSIARGAYQFADSMLKERAK